MEETCDVVQQKGSNWVTLGPKFQFIALEGKCFVKVRECSELCETGLEAMRESATFCKRRM